MFPDIVPGFEETDADRAYTPISGCDCADCEDDQDFAAREAEVTR